MADDRVSSVQSKINEVRQRLSAMNASVVATSVPTPQQLSYQNSSSGGGGGFLPAPNAAIGASQTPFRSYLGMGSDGRLAPSSSNAGSQMFGTSGAGPSPLRNHDISGNGGGVATSQVESLKERLRARLAAQQASIDNDIRSFPSPQTTSSPPTMFAEAGTGPVQAAATGGGSSSYDSLNPMQKMLRGRIDHLAQSTQHDQQLMTAPPPGMATSVEGGAPQPAVMPPPQPQPLLSHLMAGFSGGEGSTAATAAPPPPARLPRSTNAAAVAAPNGNDGRQSPRAGSAPRRPTTPSKSNGGAQGGALPTSATPGTATRGGGGAAAATLAHVALGAEGNGMQTVALTGAEVFAILRLRGVITSHGTTGEHLLPQTPVHHMAVSSQELQQLNHLREVLRSQFRQAPRGASERRPGSVQAPPPAKPVRAANREEAADAQRWR